jgi:rhamnogalacturonan endolyase
VVVDDDGRGLYTTRLGHGDAINLIQLSPNHRGLQVWTCLESGEHGLCLREAGTGKVLKRVTSFRDTPRALAGDIDPEFPGTEFWGPVHEGLYTADMESRGRRHKDAWPGQSFLVWWTGDMTRSWLAGNRIGGYSAAKGRRSLIRELEGGCSNNGSKDNPCFSGDILGDWREEVILRNAQDPTELRLYVSDMPTEYRFWTFLQDPVYRISLATESVGYNQPPQPGFYFGRDLLVKGVSFRGEKFP